MIRRIALMAAAMSAVALGGVLLLNPEPAGAIIVTGPTPYVWCVPIPNDTHFTDVALVPDLIGDQPFTIVLQIGEGGHDCTTTLPTSTL